MKSKRLFLVISIFLCSLCFLACGSLPLPENFSEEMKTSTPENSVLVYGNLKYADYLYFRQSDTKYPADIKCIINRDKRTGTFMLLPVKPGSFYKLHYYQALDEASTAVYIYKGYVPINSDTIFDFKVPDKTGLFYYGSYDFISSAKNGEFKELKIRDEYNNRIEEIYALKEVLQTVKGTAWETVVNERIQEITRTLNTQGVGR